MGTHGPGDHILRSFKVPNKHSDVFQKKPSGIGGGGGAHKKPTNSSEAAEDPPEIEPIASEKPKQKPKVTLHGLEWGSATANFNDKVGVSAHAELPKELEGISRVEFQVWALTPDGKREPIDKQPGFLNAGKATKDVTLFFPSYLKNGKLLRECKMVFTAKHRDSKEEESKPLLVKQPFATMVEWEKTEDWFGVAQKLTAKTCLEDGEEVEVKIASEFGLALESKLKAKGGKLEVIWVPCLCGIDVQANGNYPEKVEFFAELHHGGEKAFPVKNFFLKVIGNTDYHSYSADPTWGIFGVHSEFMQRVKNGALDVQVKKPIIKAWFGSMVDMRRIGIKGAGGGCPYDGHRWGRIIGISDLPNQFYDGKKWVAMPDGFLPIDDEVSSCGFIKSGSGFQYGGESSAVWPDKFLDYDFDALPFVQKRKDWKADTDKRWSRKFLIRPNTCSKGIKSGGCGFPVDLALELKRVERWEANTITVCKGNFRSNAACFSLEDPDIEMAAHEVGHLVGMPDEYDGGGCDLSINGDGAVNGWDETSVMGQKMDKVKKRHYKSFSGVTETQVSEKVGKKIQFQAADI